MANKKISELPYIDGGKISGNTLVPLVTYFSAATGDTVHTYVSDLQTYLTSGITGNTVVGDFLPLSGGTVTGGTIFTAGITANTISATTYQNLPPVTFSGGTVTGPTNFTNGLTATTISATTYQNLPDNVTGKYLPLSGGTVSGATRFLSGLTANTISADTLTVTDNISSTNRTLYRATPLIGFSESVDYENSKLWGINAPSIDWELRQIYDEQATMAINYSGVTRYLIDDIGQTSVDWQARKLYTSIGEEVFDWENGILTGQTNIESSTISATTYLNLPSGLSGEYLPLSGGTVTGGTVFTSGVTANTISQTSYIDFTTGATNPSAFAGRLFFDSGEKALSYFDIINDTVPIAMGQQLYTRVWNNTGVQIDKGKVIAITGTSNNLPSAILATNNHAPGSDRPIGVAAENIPNGSEGLVINNGILSGITLNTFSNGDTLYLSDTVPGGYVSSTSSLSFTARTNEIGYVIQTGTTTGKIYVNINNEDSNLTLTDIERNILEGNVVSTGAYEFTGISIASSTTVNVAPMRGWVVQNTYSFATLPDVTSLYYSGGTGITITNIATADATYLLVNSASTLYQQTTFPTPQQRRENVFLGKVVHPNRTSLLTVNNTVDYDVSPMSALRDLWSPIKLINQGVLPSFNTGLTFNTSLGSLYGNGIGWTTNQLNPNSVTISAKTSASFFYRTQTGGTSGSVSVIDPTKYDVNGVITSVGTAGSNDATNQRIYLYPTGVINVLYGQTRYATLTEAIANIDSETFVTYPNAETTAILIGVISVRNDIVDDGQPLTNTNYAKLTLVSKFGESFGGTGGLSTTNLQQAYNNSTEPEILINSTLDGLSIQNGTGNADNVTQLLQGKNTAGTTTSFIRADGAISASTISATTISATTYQNLPTDVRVTGSTYSNNTFTYTNNTGGTFNVLFNTVTGLTVNGNLTVTGNTNVRAFTGTSGTISGTGQSILTVIGSGNSTTSPIFSVQGSSGELFSVTDSLVGSLFSVNDISGLPIMEVFSDNTTLWGSYQAPSLNTTTRTSLTAGTNTIYSIPTSAYTGAFYEYTLISTGTTGARAGQIMSIWSGTSANFTETSTLDIGTTTGVTFTVAVSGSNAVLSSSATTAGWTVKTIIRSI
jgi:hypothetical protein